MRGDKRGEQVVVVVVVMLHAFFIDFILTKRLAKKQQVLSEMV